VSAADPHPPNGRGSDRLAWFDVSAGAAGDMLCGALVGAGVPLAVVQNAADAVVADRIRWERAEVHRAGLTATAVIPHIDADDPTERAWGDIRELLAGADLPAAVRDAATLVFTRLAETEAAAHGVAVEDVHLHEVGGLDAIADVVGVAAGLHHLGVTEVVAGPLAVGSGTVRTAHGVLPVPVPAVVRLCRGWQIEAGGTGELATPTGAALITTLARACEPLPAMALEASGVGAGSRDTPGRANVVRVLLGTSTSRTAVAPEAGTTQVVLEANVDDLDPRLWPGVLGTLLDDGAADAWLTPILMKKGRPAHTVSVLAPPARVEALRRTLMTTTSTIGCRTYPVTKHALDRRLVQIEVEGHPIAVKVATEQGSIVSAMPEFDDVGRAATALARSPREVLEQARVEVIAAGLVAGAPVPMRQDPARGHGGSGAGEAIWAARWPAP
jgi:pyridinium-3,5-bisthiocarboxylic acid mononucleotide nickel chelatase